MDGAMLIIPIRKATDPAPRERTAMQVELVALRQVAPRAAVRQAMVLRVTAWHTRAPAERALERSQRNRSHHSGVAARPP
jgi:hypothetical protein